MILFYDDWAKYGAFPNVETTNQSFLRLAAVYKEMGIRNYSFILALHDKDLVGVDPFDPNLPITTILKIAVEAKVNPWFFMRECVKAPPQAGVVPVPFRAHRGNVSMWWLFFNHITNILIQIRQTGKSFSSDSLAAYLMNVRCSNTQINLLTKDDTLRKANIERIKSIEDNLPYYFKQRNSKDICNTEMLTVKANGNTYMGHVPQKSEKMALNVGRGLTSPIFFIDEGPFQPNIGISLPAALTAGTAARKAAEAAGEPYGTVITTTAGKKDDRDGSYMYDMMMQSAFMSEHFYDARNREELELMIRKNSSRGVLRVSSIYNHTQLGYDDKWLKEAIEGAENITPEDANRDFFNMWTAGSLYSPLSVALLEKIKNSMTEPKHETRHKEYITRWYIQKEEVPIRLTNGKFVLSMDSSEAQGGDDISLTLMDIESGEVIAAGNYNETNIITFAEFVANWIIEWSNITFIPERKSTGSAIVDVLLRILPTHGINPFRRIFNRVVNDYEEYPDRFEEVNVSLNRLDPRLFVEYKKFFGFTTSSGGITSRSDLYSVTLQNAAKNVGDKVFDFKTVNQITSLIVKNGRVDHPPGGKDDMVISWLLAYWLISQGKNLGFYGIDYRSILRKVVVTGETKLDDYTVFQQERIREEMESIYQQLKTEKDSFISSNLEFRLKHLDTKLIRKQGDVFSIDELINNIRETKKKNRTTTFQNYGQPRPVALASGYVDNPYAR